MLAGRLVLTGQSNLSAEMRTAIPSQPADTPPPSKDFLGNPSRGWMFLRDQATARPYRAGLRLIAIEELDEHLAQKN